MDDQLDHRATVEFCQMRDLAELLIAPLAECARQFRIKASVLDIFALQQPRHDRSQGIPRHDGYHYVLPVMWVHVNGLVVQLQCCL